jgi:rubrerythrin
MQGVVQRRQVLAHPIVIFEGFGLKVLVRALFAGPDETFLDIVTRCAEEESRSGMDQIDLLRTVDRFTAFERRARDIYAALARQLKDHPAAGKFLARLSNQEEGHAIVLSRVRREIRRGRLWAESKDLHVVSVDGVHALLERFEAEVRGRVPLARALEIVEAIEASEMDVVFDTLNRSVDMRSRARFERFFVLNENHLAYCREQVQRLRAGEPLPATAQRAS